MSLSAGLAQERAKNSAKSSLRGGAAHEGLDVQPARVPCTTWAPPRLRALSASDSSGQYTASLHMEGRQQRGDGGRSNSGPCRADWSVAGCCWGTAVAPALEDQDGDMDRAVNDRVPSKAGTRSSRHGHGEAPATLKIRLPPRAISQASTSRVTRVSLPLFSRLYRSYRLGESGDGASCPPAATRGWSMSAVMRRASCVDRLLMKA